MTRARRFWAVAGAGSLATIRSACSIDSLIWGPDGAEVIQTTERLIEAAAAGDGAPFVCADHHPDLGEPEDWEGLAAEEPERFVAEYWPDQVPSNPAWSINLSLPTDRVHTGAMFPGDVFYQETDAGLCLVDIAWSTVL